MMRAQVASDRINIAKPIIGKETLEQIEQILESGYSIQGTETIDSKSCWKIETHFGESGDIQEYFIWIDQTNGNTLKAEIEDQEFTGPLAGVYGNMTLAFFMGLSTSTGEPIVIRTFSNGIIPN